MRIVAVYGRLVVRNNPQKRGKMSETKKAVVVQPNGSAEVIEFTSDTALATLQKAVDGYIEPVSLDENFVMWVNEEGLLRNDLVSNYVGAILYQEVFQIPNPINGTIVFTGGTDEEGYTQGLTTAQVFAALSMADVAYKASNQQ